MRQGLKFYIKIIFAALFSVSVASAAGMSTISVLPYSVTNMSDVAIDSQIRLTRSNNAVTHLDIYLSCFGTNLRAVANPISPVSDVTAYITFQRSGGDYKVYQVTFPAGAAVATQSLSQDLTGSSKVIDTNTNTVLEMFGARLRGNLIRVQMKNTASYSVDFTQDGVLTGQIVNPNGKSAAVTSIRFEQTMPSTAPKTKYMGMDGPLSANLTWYFAENGKHTTVYAAFPGENGFCGGYFSPLMLSFDEDLPQISGTSSFKLYPKAEDSKDVKFKYSWPSFKNKIYFLAVDKNSNGKIDSGEELFGDVNGFDSGFSNLASFDDNKDGVINKDDQIFSKLLLWRDLNKDGISQKSELFKIEKFGITSISLKYKNDVRYSGNQGKIVGPAVFEYESKPGESKQGKVWDVFLTLVP